MLKINQYNTWRKDLVQYKRDIENIDNTGVKDKCYNILNQLSREFSYIDSVHDITNKSIDPTKIRENVERSIQLRQQLNKIIKDSKDL